MEYETHDDICDVAVDILKKCKIIGWFLVAMEIGSHALGSRSILVIPAFSSMNDKINAEVKLVRLIVLLHLRLLWKL